MVHTTVNEVCGEILHTLAEKLNTRIESFSFEKPVQFKTTDIAPQYYDKHVKASRDVEMTALNHSALQYLGSNGYFNLRYNDALGAYDMVMVSADQAKLVYIAANMVPHFVITDSVRSAILCYSDNNHKEIREFVGGLAANDFKGFRYSLPKSYLEKIQKNHAVTQEDYYTYWNNVMCGADAVLSLSEPVLVKNLSKTLYGDSKALERYYLSGIARIIDPEMCSTEASVKEILERHNVFSVPPAVSVRGDAIIRYSDGQSVDLTAFRYSIKLSPEQVQTITSCSCKAIVTIENETVFESMPLEPGTIFIYSGGFANNVVIELLNTVMACTGITEIEHFGDLDPSGFGISKDIARRLVHGTLRRRWMDRDSLPRYIGLMQMGSLQRKRFTAMLQDPYYTDRDRDIMQVLLDRNVVAEQEGFCFA